MWQVDSDFESHRSSLERLAYRMLGSRADAEDVMQEAFLRWTRAERENVRNPRAFLNSIVTRLSIDRKREIDARKETYVGPWLPEPYVDPEATADRATEVAETVSLALMHVLERLSPVERAAYLLREVFDFDYSEISNVLEKSEANCRQIVSRADERVHAERPRFEASREEVARMSERFLNACATGDYDGLVQLFSDDVVAISDGGGKVAAALRPIEGSDKVARFFIGILKKAPPDARIERALVNGQPGLLMYVGPELENVVSFDVVDGRIREVLIVRNPEKLDRIIDAIKRPSLS
jgi:RNA polymerase sigma-70 factor, ECF subfamily